MKLWIPGKFGAAKLALALSVLAVPVFGADSDAAALPGTVVARTDAGASKTAQDGNSAADIAQLKAQLAAQQQQIEQLRLALEAQQKFLNRAATSSASDEKQSGFSLPNSKK